jgi:hypothetical protein
MLKERKQQATPTKKTTVRVLTGSSSSGKKRRSRMVKIGNCMLLTMVLTLAMIYYTFYGVPGSGDAGVSQYALVIDAGSSGSRLHLYEFSVSGSKLDLKDELFKPLKPGLSSYNKDPPKGGESIRPLLEAAKSRVPEELQSATPLFLGATAGLRMLGEEQANVLLGQGVSTIPIFLPSVA